MPDKEFDKLFREKFADAEIAPSTDFWANIEKELEPKKKRVVPIYWMAAASVAVAITAFLLFQKKEVIKLQGQDPIAVAEPVPVGDTTSPSETIGSAQKVFAQAQTTSKEQGKQLAVEVHQRPENKIQENQIALQPTPKEDRLPIKQQDPKPIDVLTPKDTPVENQVVIAQAPVTEKIDDQQISEGTSERKGIRNVGDLVNYVVDKVDKRERKLVRFNTDDDDNSSIIGINIGFLKLNKKK